MRSSTVSAMQEFHCDCVSFKITPNWVQEITCCFQTTLVRLFHPLIVSVKETKMVIPAAETSPSKWH